MSSSGICRFHPRHCRPSYSQTTHTPLNSVYYSVLFRLFTIFNTVVIIHIHAEFYLGIWFSFAQKAHNLHMARYVLIDVSFR